MITFWGFPEIAEFTGKTSNHLRNMRHRGNFPEPDAMVSNSPGWSPKTIEDWWEDRAENPPQRGAPKKA